MLFSKLCLEISNNFIVTSVCTFIVQINIIQYIFKQLWQILNYVQVHKFC